MSSPNDMPTAFLPYAPRPDRDSERYWKALGEGRFELQRCGACRAIRWPARALCNRCRSFDYAWEETDATGHIISWVRTHQAFAPELVDSVPYYVVQIALCAQEDILMIGGWLADRAPQSGEAVTMEIVMGPEGFHLPCWRPNRSI